MQKNPEEIGNLSSKNYSHRIKIYPRLGALISKFRDPSLAILMGVASLLGFLDSGHVIFRIGIWFFLPAGLVWFLYEFYRICPIGPHVEINERGIWDRRGNFGLVKWESIRLISLVGGFDNQIRVYSWDITSASRITKLLSKIEIDLDWEGRRGDDALCIEFGTLAKSAKVVWPAVVQHCRQRGFKCDDGWCRQIFNSNVVR